MIALLFGLILGLIHYFSEKIHLKYFLHKTKLVSFAAGISIAFIFLELFPELFSGTEYMHRLSVLTILIGFTLVHVIEKHVYKHFSLRKIKRELGREHSIAFFFYHFVIGIILASIIRGDFITGLLFFFTLVFHTAVSSISLKEVEKLTEKNFVKIIASISTFLGVLTSLLIPIGLTIYHLMMGFVVGIFLYIVIRDFLPKEREGKLSYFIFGVIIYAIIIGLTWLI